MRPTLPFDVLAPGKVVIAGEYAVLDGAPALVLAIDRGVCCQVREGDGVVTPDGDDRFVRPALVEAPRALYRFSAWNPVDLPGKPGFGGSAAACVAACVAAGRPAEDAFAIHHAVQGGGSGLDVAASIHGGLIRFQGGQATSIKNVFCFSLIWSGQSAATGPRVRRYQAWPGREAFVARSAALVSAFEQDPLQALAEDAALLVAMAAHAGLDYLTPALSRIMALAHDFGGAAKPSGAGGGDCAVAILPDSEASSAFERACAAEGLLPIEAAEAPGAAAVPASAAP